MSESAKIFVSGTHVQQKTRDGEWVTIGTFDAYLDADDRIGIVLTTQGFVAHVLVETLREDPGTVTK